MSDALKLKDCIAEYRKANKTLDEKMTKIESDTRRIRREATEQSNRSK